MTGLRPTLRAEKRKPSSLFMPAHCVYVGLGANIGDARATIDAAVSALSALPHTRLTGVSAHYRSAPVDAAGPDFINAVACLETRRPPLALLGDLRAIEARFGRQRPYPNAPRTLDLDLLFHGTSRLGTPALTLPHPRWCERAFVVLPLMELTAQAPDGTCLADLLPALAIQSIERLP